jgi:hypothetical protein
MQPGAMLFPHLLNRKSFVTELGELDKFFLNLLQSFLPAAVSDVGFCSPRPSKPILFIQRLNVGDFRPKTRNLFPKNLLVNLREFPEILGQQQQLSREIEEKGISVPWPEKY